MTDNIEYGPDANLVRRHAKKLYSEREYNARYRRHLFFKPSPKQLEFANADPRLTEVRLIAANQSGKSTISMCGERMDATGDYAEWVKPENRKFIVSPKIHRPHEYMSWIVCTSSQVQKQTLQLNLLGNLDDPNGMGTGFLALDEIIGKPVMQAGRQGVVESVTVRRVTGGTASIGFRSMEQDISAFAGATLDQVRWDEPGPIRTYLECLTRLTAVPNSRVVVTLTPTEGRDQLYMRFEEPSKRRKTFRMTLYDAAHLTKEQIEEIIARTPPEDRPMRIFGEPAQGSGSVYTTPESDIKHDRPLVSFNQPWLKWGWAIDITHGGTSADASAFAAVLGAYDEHTDTIYVVDVIKLHRALIPVQASAVRRHQFGDCIVLWPKDSTQTGDAMTGQNFAQLLKREGLHMATTWVRNDRGVAPSKEDGVAEVGTRLATGKLKVAGYCTNWFDEYRAYHRRDRKIVNEFCDVMDATRILVTGVKQFRHLQDSPNGYASQQPQRDKHQWDIFTGQPLPSEPQF